MQDPTDDAKFLTDSFSDSMVNVVFSPNALTLLYAHGKRAEELIRSNYRATQDDLEDAKKALKTMNAIFFTERLETWIDDYKNSGLPFADSANLCEVGHAKT